MPLSESGPFASLSTNYKERILQFGTGILLKGLPDYLIHLANQKSDRGKIAMIKSTSPGPGFDPMPPYVLLEKGIKNGESIENPVQIDVISREINAQTQWTDLLDLARSPDLEVVISNTTEAGLQWAEEKLSGHCPNSFPAKLLALLFERFKAGLPGWIIIPCELVTDNGKILKDLIFKLSEFNGLPADFLNWLETENHFCNSLVDRIVSGKTDQANIQKWKDQFPNYLSEWIDTEPYCLWAIECNDLVRKKLGWSGIHPNWILADDISMYRERKLRILNGTHTFMVGYAILKGKKTVLETMQDPVLQKFVTELALDEIASSTAVDPEIAQEFARDVLERFANPNIQHKLLSITLQYSMKMAMRNLVSISLYENRFQKTPEKMAMGFAAYLRFSRPVENQDGKFWGEWNQEKYPIQDDKASVFHQYFLSGKSDMEVIDNLMNEKELWGEFQFSSAFREKVKNAYLELEKS